MPLKLFIEILIDGLFHFYDKPDNKKVKSDSSHYISETGRHVIHPHVAVVEDKTQPRKSIYDQTQGDSDER